MRGESWMKWVQTGEKIQVKSEAVWNHAETWVGLKSQHVPTLTGVGTLHKTCIHMWLLWKRTRYISKHTDKHNTQPPHPTHTHLINQHCISTYLWPVHTSPCHAPVNAGSPHVSKHRKCLAKNTDRWCLGEKKEHVRRPLWPTLPIKQIHHNPRMRQAAVQTHPIQQWFGSGNLTPLFRL